MRRASGTEMVVTVIFMLAMFVGIAWYSDHRNTVDTRTIQCETLGGTYHDGQCIEIAGTIELPEEES